jgi:phosphoribosylaminoimidazole-succinocarboxamide synthase
MKGTVNEKVVIIKGSRSDRPFCDNLGRYFSANGIEVMHRTASAHRTPSLVQAILEECGGPEIRCFVTVAGASDALSGAVAANTDRLVIAYPPDLAEFGEAKVFSTTKLPRGIRVQLAHSPEEVLQIIRRTAPGPAYSREELDQRRMKVVETYFTDNQDRGIDTPIGLPLFWKGKVRDVYDLGDRLLINSSDRISAFDVNSVTRIEGKGVSLNLLSAWWFKGSSRIFPNHLLDTPDVSMALVKKAKRIDIEWVVRGYLYGSMQREYARGERVLYGHRLPNGLRLAEKLPEVLLTPTTKADVGHDIPITKGEAIDRGILKPDQWKELEEAVFKLYSHYTSIAGQKGFIIPDFKLEFGFHDSELIQIDEAPDHDSARLWIEKHYVVGERQEGWCADKEFYRQFLLDSGVDPARPPDPLPEVPRLVVNEIQKRLGIYEVFSGEKSIESFRLRSLEDVETELGMRSPGGRAK